MKKNNGGAIDTPGGLSTFNSENTPSSTPAEIRKPVKPTKPRLYVQQIYSFLDKEGNDVERAPKKDEEYGVWKWENMVWKLNEKNPKNEPEPKHIGTKTLYLLKNEEGSENVWRIPNQDETTDDGIWKWNAQENDWFPNVLIFGPWTWNTEKKDWEKTSGGGKHGKSKRKQKSKHRNKRKIRKSKLKRK